MKISYILSVKNKKICGNIVIGTALPNQSDSCKIYQSELRIGNIPLTVIEQWHCCKTELKSVKLRHFVYSSL